MPETSNTTINKSICSVLDFHLDDTGVIDFFWPTSFASRDKFSTNLVNGYINIVNAHMDDDAHYSYIFASKYFLHEVIGIFYAKDINQGFVSVDIEPVCDENFRLWFHAFQDKVPNDPLFIEKLKFGINSKNTFSKYNIFKKLKRIKSLLSFGKDGFAVGNLKVKPISQHTLREDIIATERTRLIQDHATRVEKDVVFCRSGRWFKPITDYDLRQLPSSLSVQIENEIINLVVACFKAQGISLEQEYVLYFRNILRRLSSILHIHFSRLIANPNEVPVNVWTGTGGQIWDNILRTASYKLHDGQTVGHDHGSGLGHVDNYLMGVNEFSGCSEFVCINNGQADEIKRLSASWPTFRHNKPKLKGWPVGDACIVHEMPEKLAKNRKKVILLVSLTGGDRVWMGPFSSDIILNDFYARACTKLKNWGYDVILKTHPELPYPPAELINLAHSVRTEPLEEMMQEGDIVLFDHVYTTVFRSVLSSNMPMVLIDFYDHPWTNKALTKLNKRVGFVAAGFDKDNRPKVDWNLVKDAITDAEVKHNDTTFFDYYYG